MSVEYQHPKLKVIEGGRSRLDKAHGKTKYTKIRPDQNPADILGKISSDRALYTARLIHFPQKPK